MHQVVHTKHEVQGEIATTPGNKKNDCRKTYPGRTQTYLYHKNFKNDLLEDSHKKIVEG